MLGWLCYDCGVPVPDATTGEKPLHELETGHHRLEFGELPAVKAPAPVVATPAPNPSPKGADE